MVAYRCRPGRHRPLLASILRRFDLKHSFRLLQLTLGWTRPRLRPRPAQASKPTHPGPGWPGWGRG